MSTRHISAISRLATGAATVAAVALLAPLAASPVAAQSSGSAELSSGLSSSGALQELLAGSSGNTSSTNGSSLNALMSSMSALGSSEFPLPDGMIITSDQYPLELDESIQTPQVVSREPEGGGVERWTIASPAMARNVEIQIRPPSDPSQPAPMLYLLDGVDAHRDSEWLSGGGAADFFAEENITLVMPTQARASMYADWESDDPNLGRHQWETFLAEELPLLLEAEPQLNHNGRTGIGGLSMGATGAVHLANSRPELFDAVFGLSGCYSTMDPVGRYTAQLTIESRGGDVDNIYGPYGSQAWQDHDVVADPEGLRDTAVYLAAADGEYLLNPDRDPGTINPQTMMTAILLEQGANVCTQNLDAAMKSAGMEHQVVEYTGAGVHNWANFAPQLPAAWDTIRPALY